MGLVESFDRMTINRKFLKYKPVKPVRQDPRGWWNYAITAVLEEDVKRRLRMWSWKHIKQHRWVGGAPESCDLIAKSCDHVLSGWGT